MSRIGIKGLVTTDLKSIGAVQVASIPVLDWLFAQIHNVINGQIDSTNIAASGVATANLADASVTAGKLAALSVTSAAVDSTVAKIATAQFTGDGTSNREINLGWRARFVVIVNHTTRQLFIAWGGTGSAFAALQIDAAGNITTGGTDFTGSSTNGVTLGSAAGGGASNTNAVTYSYAAIG